MKKINSEDFMKKIKFKKNTMNEFELRRFSKYPI